MPLSPVERQQRHRRLYQARWVADKRARQRDQQQADDVESAFQTYLDKLATAVGIRRCPSVWSDGETRCQLVDGHDRGPEPTEHRHKPAGATHVVVTW